MRSTLLFGGYHHILLLLTVSVKKRSALFSSSRFFPCRCTNSNVKLRQHSRVKQNAFLENHMKNCQRGNKAMILGFTCMLHLVVLLDHAVLTEPINIIIFF